MDLKPRLVFLHIPKTGGIAIRAGMRGRLHACLKHRGFANKTLTKRLWPHMQLDDTLTEGNELAQDWFKTHRSGTTRHRRGFEVFAVIRDPVTRTRSAYAYLMYGATQQSPRAPIDKINTRQYILPFGNSLQEFIMSGGLENASRKQVHFRPQRLWLRSDMKNESHPCNLLPFEDLETSLNKFLLKHGHDTVQLPLRNVSRTDPDSPLDIDSSAKDVIHQIYEDDLNLWRHIWNHA